MCSNTRGQLHNHSHCVKSRSIVWWYRLCFPKALCRWSQWSCNGFGKHRAKQSLYLLKSNLWILG